MENKAKQKAIELVEKFKKYSRIESSGFYVSNEDVYIKSAKQCALIACDEILDVFFCDDSDYGTRMFNFFKSVKEEINNLK